MIPDITKLDRRQCVLLLAGLAFACVTHAQSAIRQVPQATEPYVPLYSACRANPPADPVAQQLYERISERQEFAALSSQLDELRSKPLDALTSIEAEAYFVVLIAIEYQIVMELDAAEAIGAAVIDGRKHGEAISQKFSGDSFVRCAYLASESRVTNALGVRERFGDRDRRKARSDLRAFKERALRGEVAHEMYPDLLQSAIGQRSERHTAQHVREIRVRRSGPQCTRNRRSLGPRFAKQLNSNSFCERHATRCPRSGHIQQAN